MSLLSWAHSSLFPRPRLHYQLLCSLGGKESIRRTFRATEACEGVTTGRHTLASTCANGLHEADRSAEQILVMRNNVSAMLTV